VLAEPLEGPARVADGLIPRNPATGLKLPRIIREEIDPLTEEESRRLLEAVRGERLEALYILALSTGMRQGELLALKWEDVDLEGGSNLRNRSFKPLLKRSGLPQIRFHDLRHTCATLLLSKNVNPKVVSEMLGHSSISITLDIYSHLLPDM
jgi:integrase